MLLFTAEDKKCKINYILNIKYHPVHKLKFTQNLILYKKYKVKNRTNLKIACKHSEVFLCHFISLFLGTIQILHTTKTTYDRMKVI